MKDLSAQQAARLDELMSQLTWAEKLNQIQVTYKTSLDECEDAARGGIGALFWPGDAASTNAVQRAAVEESAHGIPLLIGLDVIHGQRTIFPIPLALAASFDPEIARLCARTSAAEARSGGVNWTYSPMIDVSRDARWGRVAEGFGEDPLLSAAMGAAMIRGYQETAEGRRFGEGTLAACAKHFVAYGACEGGRDYNGADMSASRLREVYLPPFRAAVEAGAATVMASFNTLNGVPMHANRALLDGVLKEEWGFQGFIVGDASGVENLVPHGVARDLAEAARLSIGAGLDMEMGGHLYSESGPLLEADDPALVARVDDACRRVLATKLALGLFENPYVPENEEHLVPSPEHLALARKIAERCPVLLTNDGILPLGPRAGERILLIGPAAATRDHLGAWVQRFGAEPEHDLAHALRSAMPEARIDVLDGCSPIDPSPELLEEARQAIPDYDLVILALTEPSDLTGEASSRADLRLPGDQEELVRIACASGAPVVVVLMNGRPLDISAWIDLPNAVLEAWHLGSTGPEVIADILSGAVAPTGRLPMAFPRSVGQLPAIHHAHENTGRPATRGGSIQPKTFDVGLEGPANIQEFFTSKYRDLELGPLFEFGHGLGYSPIEVRSIELDSATVSRSALDEGLRVRIRVENTGSTDVEHALLLYVRDPLASVARPVKSLVAFDRVHVPAGTLIQVEVRIDAASLSFWSELEGGPVLEGGDFELHADGPNGPAITRFSLVADDSKEDA